MARQILHEMFEHASRLQLPCVVARCLRAAPGPESRWLRLCKREGGLEEGSGGDSRRRWPMSYGKPGDVWRPQLRVRFRNWMVSPAAVAVTRISGTFLQPAMLPQTCAGPDRSGSLSSSDTAEGPSHLVRAAAAPAARLYKTETSLSASHSQAALRSPATSIVCTMKNRAMIGRKGLRSSGCCSRTFACTRKPTSAA